MQLKSIKEADLNHKTVILRADFNVPLNNNLEIDDDARIRETIPTIEYILNQNAKLVIISHLGRPEGKTVSEMSLKPVAKHLEKLLPKTKINFHHDCIGKEVQNTVQKLKIGEILLLENLRFYQEEEDNAPQFAKELASLADIYINDAFATSHRAHASMVGIPEHIPGYAGFLVLKEVEALSKAFDHPQHPICVILGGAKVDTKVGMIKHYVKQAEYILLGGALANTFIAARGFFVAESKYEEKKIELAQEIMLEAEKEGCYVGIPRDVIVSSEINEQALKLDIPVEDVEGDMKIVDIGKITINRYLEAIKKSKTVIWNGPVGIHEFNRFSHGSKRIAEAIIESKAVSIVGGGDTIDFLEKYGYDLNKFTHVSTAGGAMIEYLEGKELPGLKAVS
jgi:phosphoglycerate kinase